MIERLAEWYLKRCGRAVLPRYFRGMAVGNGMAWREYVPPPNPDDPVVAHDEWRVTIPRDSDLIALNGSFVERDRWSMLSASVRT